MKPRDYHWPDPEEGLAELLKVPLIRFEINGPEALCLLGALQLAFRHPLFDKSKVSEMVRAFALELEDRIVARAPQFKELCAAGWRNE